MTITIDGTSGIASVDGSAGSPSVRGSDSNSGIVYAADTVSISTGGTERLEVDSSGNIDIPDNGKIRLGGAGDLSLYHDGANSFIDDAGTGNLVIRASKFSVECTPGGGEKMIEATTNGSVDLYYDNVMTAKTTSTGFKTGATIPGDHATGGLIINSSGESSLYRSSNGIVFIIAGPQSGQKLVEWRHVGTGIGSVTKSGTSGISYNTSSDYRLKENNVAISDGITRLKTLKPYRFNFKVDPDSTVDGFFAHEVSPVVPEAITGTKDEVDSDDKPVYQGIDQSKLVPLLTAALQEAITKIETLEAKVAALEAA